jgi:glutamate/tyrosine decarboxylase-like PLP-dependent enzyme
MHGTEVYRKAVEIGLDLAQKAKELIDENPNLEMVREPGLSCVLFRRKGWKPEDYYQWTYKNHKENIALVTPTKWQNEFENETVARFCFINPDTTEEDLKVILETMN